MRPKTSFFIYCFLIIGLFASCQPKDTFDWNAGLSGPKNYPSGAPFVEYFYHGKSIAGASSGTGADQGWGITSGGYVGGDKYKPVPDSMGVKWVCSIDNLVYRGGFKLPREKMLELFKKKVIDSYGVQNDYSVIVAGMAPGGNITLWMQGGYASTEIAKFKVLKGEEDINIDDDYKKKEIKSWGNYLTYWKIHGIPYSVWEKGEKEYDYDIVFCNEADKTNYDRRITGFSKDGSIISSNSDRTSFKTLKWNERFNVREKKIKFKSKLPTHIFLQWSTKDNAQWCESEIVLPNDFENRFKQGYFNWKIKRREQYNRIIIGLEGEKENTPFIFGRIWLSGSNQKVEIMRFRAIKFDTIARKFQYCKYSLPKDFVLPKWKDREPIVFPELDYWQEK